MPTYVDEEEVWRCQKHPSKRRRNGVCPTCLRERLVSLCPPDPCEPTLRRSRSLAIPILRVSFLSGLMRSKTRRKEVEEEIVAVDDKIEEFSRMVTRSRSVSASSTAKSKFWNFAAFTRKQKVVLQDRSPLQRG